MTFLSCHLIFIQSDTSKLPVRYFLPGRSQICSICNRIGHLSSSCYYQKVKECSHEPLHWHSHKIYHMVISRSKWILLPLTAATCWFVSCVSAFVQSWLLIFLSTLWQKSPMCILCGTRGHVCRDCPSRPCSSCGLPSHAPGPCKRPPVWNQHCQRCGVAGHLLDVSLFTTPLSSLC